MEDYRKKYKRFYDIDFDRDFAIHHIDFDRNNNEIENLLLLPRGLHNKYHSSLSAICDENHLINGRIDKLGKFACTSFLTLGEALREIEKWKKWKKYNYDEYLKDLIFEDAGVIKWETRT